MNNVQRKRTTRNAILRAARAEFAASGFATTSMRAVSGAAGVAYGTVFWHFANKPELYREVMRQAADELESEIGDTPSLGELTLRLIDFLDNNPDASSLIASSLGSGGHPDVAPSSAVLEERLYQLYRRAVDIPDESGAVCPPARRDELAGVIVALVCGLLAVRRSAPPPLHLLTSFVDLAEQSYRTPVEFRREQLARVSSA